MPGFADPFSILSNGRKLSKEELIRAIRFMAAAEFEATQQYSQFAEACDEAIVKKAILKILDEERVHAGEFLRLLYYLSPEEKKLHMQGMQEVTISKESKDSVINSKTETPEQEAERIKKNKLTELFPKD